MAQLSAKGYLIKQGSFFKTWKKRWFMLAYDNNRIDVEGPSLLYFMEKHSLQVKGYFDLNKFSQVEICFGEDVAPSSLQDNFFFRVTTGQKSILLAAISERERLRWMKAIQTSCSRLNREVSAEVQGQIQERVEKQNRMIEFGKTFIQAWISKDESLFFSIASEDIVIDIQKETILVDSREKAWSIRQSMRTDPLANYSFTTHIANEKTLMASIDMHHIHPSTNAILGMATVTLHFDSNCQRVIRYQQEETTALPSDESFEDPWLMNSSLK
jgi:hypothetical protein